jgi:hypothetical protein
MHPRHAVTHLMMTIPPTTQLPNTYINSVSGIFLFFMSNGNQWVFGPTLCTLTGSYWNGPSGVNGTQYSAAQSSTHATGLTVWCKSTTCDYQGSLHIFDGLPPPSPPLPPPTPPSPPPVPPPSPPPPNVAITVASAACASSNAYLSGGSTVTYTLSNTLGAGPVSVAAGINAALASSSAVIGLEASGVGVDFNYGGSLTLFSIATGLRCGVMSGGVLNRTGFPADAGGNALFVAPVVGSPYPPAFSSAPATLVCSSCISWAAPPTAACQPAHRFSPASASSGPLAYFFSGYSMTGMVSKMLSGSTAFVADTGSAAPALPSLFAPFSLSGPSVAQRSDYTSALYGLAAYPVPLLELNVNGGNLTAQTYTLGGAALSVVLTVMLPSAPGTNSGLSLLRMSTSGAYVPGALQPAYSMQLYIIAGAGGFVNVSFSVSSGMYYIQPTAGALSVISPALFGNTWVTVVFTVGSGGAQLFVRDALQLGNATSSFSMNGVLANASATTAMVAGALNTSMLTLEVLGVAGAPSPGALLCACDDASPPPLRARREQCHCCAGRPAAVQRRPLRLAGCRPHCRTVH